MSCYIETTEQGKVFGGKPFDCIVVTSNSSIPNKFKKHRQSRSIKMKRVSFGDSVQRVQFCKCEPSISVSSVWNYWSPAILHSDRLQDRPFANCILDYASIDNCGVLCGQIKVANLCYEKYIWVRLSMDNWNTFIDIQALYLCSISYLNMDIFEFEYDLNHYHERYNGLGEFSVNMAIRCVMNGEEIWDNNHSRDYHLNVYINARAPQCREYIPIKDCESHEPSTSVSSCNSVYSNYFLPTSMANLYTYNWSFG